MILFRNLIHATRYKILFASFSFFFTVLYNLWFNARRIGERNDEVKGE